MSRRPPFAGRFRVTLAASVLLTICGLLLAWGAASHSPVFGELGCLPAGIRHVQFGQFDLYRVNPPLVRTVASLPVLAVDAKTDWHRYNSDPLARPWQNLGLDFLKANGPRSFWLHTLGRWICIPFSLIGGLVCFLWARDLYQSAAGLTALILWSFCPYVLGYGALITPDAHAAAMGLAAGYSFWLWWHRQTWDGAILAGLTLGLAELTKFTLLVLYPIWILSWLLNCIPSLAALRIGPLGQRAGPPNSLPPLRRSATQMATLIGLSVLVINIGYGFEASFQRLDTFRFQSRTLTGVESSSLPAQDGNRFSGTLVGAVRVPLPANYVQGIDTQETRFRAGISVLPPRRVEERWMVVLLSLRASNQASAGHMGDVCVGGRR